MRQAEEAAARFAQEPPEPTLSPELRAQLLNLSQSLPQWWASDQLGYDQRKTLLRSLISQVVVKRPVPDRVEVRIVWVSGHFSEGVVIPPVLHQHHVLTTATAKTQRGDRRGRILLQPLPVGRI